MPIVQMIPCILELPPVGVRKALYLGDHDQKWVFGVRESASVWALETNDPEIPSHVEVERELVTHWMDEFSSPFDVIVWKQMPFTLAVKKKTAAALTAPDAGA